MVGLDDQLAKNIDDVVVAEACAEGAADNDVVRVAGGGGAGGRAGAREADGGDAVSVDQTDDAEVVGRAGVSNTNVVPNPLVWSSAVIVSSAGSIASSAVSPVSNT